MKKIFVMLCAIATLVSCGSDDAKREYYFDGEENRAYNDPEAAFDTLSYAVGMNMGLSVALSPAGNIFDIDAVIDAFNEEISKDVVDKDLIEANAEYLKRFSTEKMQRYVIARRFMADNGNSDMLPEIFDGEDYTSEKVSKAYGCDMANHTRKFGYPVNIYWMLQAMEDAKKVDNEVSIDKQMAIDAMCFRRVITKYVSLDYPEYMAERSGKWLERVSMQKDVNMMIVEGDTLYYRVDKAGHGKRPQSLRDTVSFSYDVYTMRGNLVESHEERVATLKEALAKAEADSTSKPEARDMRIGRIKSQLESVENLRVVLERAMIKGSQYGMQKVSEGGDITLWIPASLAYGSRGNKSVSPNEAIVMIMHLKSVTYGPTEEELEAQKVITPKLHKGVPMNPNGKPTITPMNPKSMHHSDETGKGVKTTIPAQKVVIPAKPESNK